MKKILLLLFISFSFTLYSKTYENIKAGLYSRSDVWKNGEMPPNPLPEGDQIIVSFSVHFLTDFVNNGEIIVNDNSYLRIFNSHFTNNNVIKNNGTFINEGTLDNNQTIIIEANTLFVNSRILNNNGEIFLRDKSELIFRYGRFMDTGFECFEPNSEVYNDGLICLDGGKIIDYYCPQYTIYEGNDPEEDCGEGGGEPEPEDFVKLSPNPASNFVNINSTKPFNWVYIMNFQGKTVTKSRSSTIQFNKRIESGYYVVRTQFKDGTFENDILTIQR